LLIGWLILAVCGGGDNAGMAMLDELVYGIDLELDFS
jgi:hypothetical protein